MATTWLKTFMTMGRTERQGQIEMKVKMTLAGWWLTRFALCNALVGARDFPPHDTDSLGHWSNGGCLLGIDASTQVAMMSALARESERERVSPIRSDPIHDCWTLCLLAH